MSQKHKIISSKFLKRNNALIDIWSLVHFSTGVALGWLLNPAVALGLMILYEPFEIFVLSPFLAHYNIEFGYEGLHNSLSDIVFDSLGILVGTTLLAALISPPFHLF